EEAAAHRRSLPTIDRARLENNASLCWYAAGDVSRAVIGWERALLGFERVGATMEAARVQVNLCQGLRELGRWARAATAGEAAVEIARRAHNRTFEAVALGNLGDIALDRRQLSEAARCYDGAEQLARELSMEGELIELARRRSELAALRRDPDALSVVQAAIARAREAGARVELARCRAVAALVLARSGASPEQQAHESLDDLLKLGASGELAIARLWIAEAYLAWGRGDKAITHAELALRFADEFARAPLARWAHRLLAWSRPSEDSERKTLRKLTELAVGVARQMELPDMLAALAKAAVELVDAERAFVVLAQGPRLEVVAQSGAMDEERLSLSVVRRTVSLGREVVVTNLEERGDLRQAESVVAMHLKAVLCVPLFQDSQPVGALYLDSREQPVGALGNQVVLLQALAAHASVALTNARLTQEIQLRARRAREVAHDLRNPLSGILLLAEEVVQTDYALEPREAELLVDGARHALQLVEDSLRSEVVSPVSFSWEDAVRRWVTAFQPQARHAGVALELSGSAPGSVRGVPVQLRRVLMNLLSNALKFGPPDAPIQIRLLAGPGELGLSVQDQGPGLPVALIERVFEPGIQGPHTVEGYGLGLAIARRICEEHGGRIQVENLEVGCRFTVWLPEQSG
ncbi:MAG TPA: HAMP domain-containing histidine kinase, partial [Deltaproteobacteria bacterium]|nr:HAMP domain-containing histidine kinase [Deltaproteobacteria bacterium]